MTTVVTGRIGPGRSFGPDDFADLTDVPVTDVSFVADGRLAVTFDNGLDDDTKHAVRRRLISARPEDEQIRADLAETATAIESWPDLTTATPDDLLARVNALTGQVKALTALVQPPDDPPDSLTQLED